MTGFVAPVEFEEVLRRTIGYEFVKKVQGGYFQLRVIGLKFPKGPPSRFSGKC